MSLSEFQHGLVDEAVRCFVREAGYFVQIGPVVPLFVVCDAHGGTVLVGQGEHARATGVDEPEGAVWGVVGGALGDGCYGREAVAVDEV